MEVKKAPTGRSSRVFAIAQSWSRSLRSLLDVRTMRGLAPAILAVAFAPFLPPLIRLELKEPLFSDTLVFQYTGWCIRHGMRLYRDVGMADGPFIHYLHAVIQLFAGITDRGFRKFDLLMQIGCGGAIGALVAPSADPRRASRVLQRLAWAAAGAALWLSWYFTLRWQWTTQREVYYSDFGLFGTALLYVSGNYDRRKSAIAVALGAFLVTTQAFGKPTGVMYPAVALLCVLMPNPAGALPLRSRLRLYAVGVGACVLAVVFALLVSGSIAGYFLWCIRIPYIGNRFLLRLGFDHLFWTDYWDLYARMAVCAFISGVAAIACGLLPLRALPFALLPPLGFLSACLQGRGYNYHAIPMIASVHVLMVIILSSLWQRAGEGDWADGRGLVAALGLSLIGYYGFCNLQDSHFRWKGDEKEYTSPEHELDAQKQAGLYIKEHSGPDDEVFAYNDAAAHVILFASERRTASPFMHSYVLDPVRLLSQSQVQPDAAELARLVQLQTDDRAMACAAIVRNQPAVMVFDSLDQAASICPEVRGMIGSDFRLSTTIGGLQIYLRKRPLPALRN
jgi:hypothetical protein